MLVAVCLISVACASGEARDGRTPSASPRTDPEATTPIAPTPGTAPTATPVIGSDGRLADGSVIPPAPAVSTGPLDQTLIEDLDDVFGSLTGLIDVGALERVGESGDARVAWLLSDLLRFIPRGQVAETAAAAFERLTDTDVPEGFAWEIVTDWLIAWDLPAAPGYVGWKRILFELIEPAWKPFFDDTDADIDWRLLSWGGVFIDNRPLSQTDLPCPGGCIPALDDPAVTDANGGDWYPDERFIFGVVINGDARAYPKHIMEVHEMVNDTVGGRRIGMAYCTLCGSAQAYYTDIVPTGFDTLELRTSGLLSRSNKVMFDLHTFSVFDTFLGVALSGPLQDEEFELEMLTVITTTWKEWKETYPETTIVAEDGGIGTIYPLDPLRGRDDDGPIFPIGEVDPRLPVQAQVLGVVTPAGQAIAFPVDQAQTALAAGKIVELGGVRLVSDGGGLRAENADGSSVTSHQSFWFAWSQFQPDTLVWTPLS